MSKANRNFPGLLLFFDPDAEKNYRLHSQIHHVFHKDEKDRGKDVE